MENKEILIEHFQKEILNLDNKIKSMSDELQYLKEYRLKLSAAFEELMSIVNKE